MAKIKEKARKTVSLFIAAVMLLGVVTVAPVAAVSTTTFTYDGYSVEYTDIDNDISITINNTGEEVIENWSLWFDDFGGNIEGVWGAVLSQTEFALELEETIENNADKDYIADFFSDFAQDYATALNYLQNAGYNAVIYRANR